MNCRFSIIKIRMLFPRKIWLTTIFVIICTLAWLGISNPRADEDDPEDNSDTAELSFQNSAQARHADNVARQAALQDPEVIALIEKDDTEGNHKNQGKDLALGHSKDKGSNRSGGHGGGRGGGHGGDHGGGHGSGRK